MKINKKINNSTFEMLPVNELITAEYQKGRLNIARAKAIAEDFDLRKAGALLISYRGGKYYILDGQHRKVAAELNDESHIMCQVLSRLSYEEECKYFVNQDSLRKAVSSLQKFKVELEYNKPDTVEIYNIVKLNGLDISFHGGPGDNTISAVVTLKKIYKKIGFDGLNRTIELITKTWNGENDSLQSKIMYGVSELIRMFGDELKDKIFIKQLKTIDIADIKRSADSSLYHGNSKKVAYAKVMLIYYNKKLRSNKLSWKV